MNVESTIVLFDSIANRKKFLDERIEACYACLELMVGNERIGTEAELKCYLDECAFIADTEYGWDKCDIYELTRVEKKTRTIVEEYWVRVND